MQLEKRLEYFIASEQSKLLQPFDRITDFVNILAITEPPAQEKQAVTLGTSLETGYCEMKKLHKIADDLLTTANAINQQAQKLNAVSDASDVCKIFVQFVTSN